MTDQPRFSPYDKAAEQLKKMNEERDRGFEEFFGIQPGTIDLFLSGTGGKSMVRPTNKYKKYADIYHAMYPRSNFYLLGSDAQRANIERIKNAL